MKAYKLKLLGFYIWYVFIGEFSGWVRIFGIGIKWKEKGRHNLTFSQRNGYEKYYETKKYYIGFLKKHKP